MQWLQCDLCGAYMDAPAGFSSGDLAVCSRHNTDDPIIADSLATTQEQKDRVYAIFKQKFRARYPDHPWVKLWDKRSK